MKRLCALALAVLALTMPSGAQAPTSADATVGKPAVPLAVRQTAYLKASNPDASDHFGCGGTLQGHTGQGVALSADGRTLAVEDTSTGEVEHLPGFDSLVVAQYNAAEDRLLMPLRAAGLQVTAVGDCLQVPGYAGDDEAPAHRRQCRPDGEPESFRRARPSHCRPRDGEACDAAQRGRHPPEGHPGRRHGNRAESR